MIPQISKTLKMVDSEGTCLPNPVIGKGKEIGGKKRLCAFQKKKRTVPSVVSEAFKAMF